jgi:hypothetical protein
MLLVASACVLGPEGGEKPFQIDVRASSLPAGWDQGFAFDGGSDGKSDLQGTAKVKATGKAEKILSVYGSRSGDGLCLLLVRDPDAPLPDDAEWDELCADLRMHALKVQAVESTRKLEKAIMEGSLLRESDLRRRRLQTDPLPAR